MKIKLFIFLFLLFSLSSCSLILREEGEQAQAIDPAELHESDRLSYRYKHEILNNDNPQTGTNKKAIAVAKATSNKTNQQSLDTFETYKAWRRAQNPDSAEYKDYQDWLEYQRYLRDQQVPGKE